MAKTSPTQRTLALLRKHFRAIQIVERWNMWAKVRVDLFGVIDIVSCDWDKGGIFGIQCTSGSNHSARIEKAKAEPRLQHWLKSGGRFWVISWAKKGARGERKTWKSRCTEVKLLPDTTFTTEEVSSIEEYFNNTPTCNHPKPPTS